MNNINTKYNAVVVVAKQVIHNVPTHMENDRDLSR